MARISSAVCLLLLVAISTVYEVQGTFLLRHYLRKIPRRSRGFRPFACRGMLKFVNLLEFKCPLKPAYKKLFGNLRSYVGAISSGSSSDLKVKAEGVQSALSALGGNGGSSPDTSKVMDVLMSMGKTLTSQTSSSSTEMTMGQRKEVLMSLVQWARVIGQVVISTASKSTGTSIDLKSLGIDGLDDDNVPTGGSTSTSTTGTSNTKTGTSTTGNFMTGSPGTGTGTSPSTGTFPGMGMAGAPASSTEGGNSFGKTFSGKTGSTNYAGSVNYESGQKSSQQTTTGNTGTPGSTVSPGSF